MAFNRKFCNSYTNFLILLNATIIIWPIDINHLTILSRSDIERGSNYILFQFRPLTNDKNRLLDRCLHVNIYFRSLSNRGATESICIVYITWVHEISYKKINVYKYIYKYRRRMYPNKSEVSTNEERSILKEHKFGAFLVSYIIRSYWYRLQISLRILSIYNLLVFSFYSRWHRSYFPPLQTNLTIHNCVKPGNVMRTV